MPTHQFTLIVEGPDLQDDALIDALYESGCDDALVGRSHGVQYLDFDRDAPSLEEAVLSAVTDVEQVAGVEVVRIAGAGLLSMADIAASTGRTRESVRLLVEGERGPGFFPAPVTDPRGRYRLWRASDVERWFEAYSGHSRHFRKAGVADGGNRAAVARASGCTRTAARRSRAALVVARSPVRDRHLRWSHAAGRRLHHLGHHPVREPDLRSLWLQQYEAPSRERASARLKPAMPRSVARLVVLTTHLRDTCQPPTTRLGLNAADPEGGPDG